MTIALGINASTFSVAPVTFDVKVDGTVQQRQDEGERLYFAVQGQAGDVSVLDRLDQILLDLGDMRPARQRDHADEDLAKRVMQGKDHQGGFLFRQAFYRQANGFRNWLWWIVCHCALRFARCAARKHSGFRSTPTPHTEGVQA